MPRKVLFVILIAGALFFQTQNTVATSASASQPQKSPEQISEKFVAITIDDLPIHNASRHTPEEQAEIFRAVIAALEKHGVSAAGFVNGKNIKPFHRELLAEFVKSGNTIGNHTFSHFSPHKVPIPGYLSDIAAGQRSIREWSSGKKIFRFPFLQQGWTEADHAQIKSYLSKEGYTVAQVTIDNDDWIFNRDYTDAAKSGDSEKMRKIGNDYLEHMKKQTKHYEVRSQDVAGRSVRHVLLLHMSKINADYLGALLAWYESDGYKFVPLTEALKDPVYSWNDAFRGESGISWLDRVISPAR